MKKLLVCFVAVMFLFAFAQKSHAVFGIPDHVPAATVIVPFFEVGIDDVAHPNDTLPVVTNIYSLSVIVHYEVWDVFGNLVGASGNLTFAPGETKSFSMRSIINSLSAGQKASLIDAVNPLFYRGFMTFDTVTSATALHPTDASYPFSSLNKLEGQIYYTRLSEGSSNGLAMLAIEALPTMTMLSNYMYGFYQSGDYREEIDSDSRYSAENMAGGGSAAANPNVDIYRVHSRIYLEYVNAATSKVIVFTFPEGGSGLGATFPGSVAYKRYDGAGNVLVDTTTNLNRVVNVIEFVSSSSPTSKSGYLSLWNIPAAFETYAFSTNSANPPGHPELTWDAIFESNIYPTQ